MTTMTKTQLVDENIRLREHSAHLEQRLAAAAEVYRTQRAEIERLRAQLTAPRTPRPEPTPVVTHYIDRFGRRWEKTRVGSTATIRLVEPAEA